MKINEDCIRDVLQYYVDELSINFISHNRCDFNEISLLKTIKHFEDKYSQEDVWYAVYNLSQDRFIETNDIRKTSRDAGLAHVSIYNVTHRGHQFNESIQPEAIWDKTKTIVSKVGVHTLGFIESVAHDVAVEVGKQAVTISMIK